MSAVFFIVPPLEYCEEERTGQNRDAERAGVKTQQSPQLQPPAPGTLIPPSPLTVSSSCLGGAPGPGLLGTPLSFPGLASRLETHGWENSEVSSRNQ